MAIPFIMGLMEFLHNLFTVFWIGGLFTLVFVVMPAIKKTVGMNPDTKKIVGAIKNRLNKIVWISIAGLALTGIPLSISSGPTLFTGFFSLANTYSLLLTLKHIVFILMVIIVIVRGFVLPKASGMAPQKNERLSLSLMMINVALGFIVLLVSGMLATTPLSP